MVRSLIVKAVARMMLLYIASFAFLLLAGLAFIVARQVVDGAVSWPSRSVVISPAILAALSDAVPLAAFGSLLTSLIYGSRHSINGFIAALIILVLSVALLCGTSLAAFRFSPEKMSFGSVHNRVLGADGRILRWASGSVVLLGSPAAGDGYSVVIPTSGSMELVSALKGPQYGFSGPPQTEFRGGEAPSPLLASLGGDLSAVSVRLRAAEAISPLALLAFCGGLCLMLISCAVIVSASRWALVNLIFCFLSLWGLLRASAFIYSPLAAKIFHELFPHLAACWLLPAVMGAVGLLIGLPGMLVHLAVSRRLADE